MSLAKINHTQIPNEFLDEWMPKLNASATLVFLVICRKTIGWHKDTDPISLSQIMVMTGLGRQGTVTALKELEVNGLIVGERKGRKSTVWGVNFNQVVHSVDQQNEQVVQSVDQQVVHSVDTQKKVLNKETQSSPSAQTLVAEFIMHHQDKTGETPVDIPKAAGIFKKLLEAQSYEQISKKLKSYYSGGHFTSSQPTILQFRRFYDAIKSISPGGNTKSSTLREVIPWEEMMANPDRKGSSYQKETV
jgi:hypothetical protein